jgi:CBS domain-containing protein
MLNVADLMSEVVYTIASSATVAEATQIMQQSQMRALIVERRQHDMPYGIVTEQDIAFKVVARELDPTRVIVQDIMRQPCIGVSPDLPMKEVLLLFADSGTQRAPVVADGKLLGVISVTDIIMKGIHPNGDETAHSSILSSVG